MTGYEYDIVMVNWLDDAQKYIGVKRNVRMHVQCLCKGSDRIPMINKEEVANSKLEIAARYNIAIYSIVQYLKERAKCPTTMGQIWGQEVKDNVAYKGEKMLDSIVAWYKEWANVVGERKIQKKVSKARYTCKSKIDFLKYAHDICR